MFTNVLTFEDGHIEYWSTYSITHGLKIFNNPMEASDYIEATNDHFVRGVMFHKELNGTDMLSRD